jgi:2-polyprenyl-6-methoxyphenol hydroxylase-like FAD-dependent oxidoreductase
MNVGLYGADNLARSLAAVIRGSEDARRLDAYAAQQTRLATLVRRATRLDVLEQPPGRARLAALKALLPAALALPQASDLLDAALGDLKLGPALTGRSRLAD